ncbi:hypothetical protein DOY81_010827, partial [Sarcophaga bullata]
LRIDQWRIVFGISFVITVVTYFVFQIFDTGDIQKWNNLVLTSSTNNDDAYENSADEENQMLKKHTATKSFQKRINL